MGLKSAHAHNFQNIVLIPALFDDFMLPCRFAYDFADGESGRKACVRVLENHLHIGAELIEFAVFKRGNVLSLKVDVSACNVVQP